jgi:hypothetical protein
MVATGRHGQQLARAAREPEGLLRMRQAVMRHQRRDVRQFGLLGAQELLARRHVEEQVAHRDGGAPRARNLVAMQHLAARDLHTRAGGVRPPSASPAAGATPMRWKAAPRRESPASRWKADPSHRAACWWRAARRPADASSRSMPQPSSAMRISRRPPLSTSTRTSLEPASSAFSSSSLTTDAGRSTTSPAAILLAT